MALAMPSLVTRVVLPTMPPRSGNDAAFLSSQSAHCFNPTVSIASCSGLGRLRKRARSWVSWCRRRESGACGALFVLAEGHSSLDALLAEVTPHSRPVSAAAYLHQIGSPLVQSGLTRGNKRWPLAGCGRGQRNVRLAARCRPVRARPLLVRLQLLLLKSVHLLLRRRDIAPYSQSSCAQGGFEPHEGCLSPCIEALVRRSECVPYSSRRKPIADTHSSTRRAYCLVLKWPGTFTRLGNAKSSTVPPRRSSQHSRLARASVVISNWTGRPVFCWITMERVRISGPATSFPILTFTKSHPRSLLSMARSNRARSRMRPSRSRKKRIAQICRGVRARLAPTCLPAFHAGRPLAAGSYLEIPSWFSFGQPWPTEKRWALSARWQLLGSLRR
jgi:hypothetical protein